MGQPIGFFPIPAGYGYGIGHYFISSHTGSTIFSFLLSGQIEVLTICFFRKHKAIMNLANPLGSSSAVYLCIYAMCVLFTGVFTTSIVISEETREEQLRVLDTVILISSWEIIFLMFYLSSTHHYLLIFMHSKILFTMSAMKK